MISNYKSNTTLNCQHILTTFKWWHISKFFGGRTGAASLYYKVDRSKGEEIRYVDVTSEYPWTNKYETYPVGHPTIITNPDQNITNYYGIAKIGVLPPHNLFQPVLP